MYMLASFFLPSHLSLKHVHAALGVLCCFALFVCLTLLASFFLPSHLSLKHVHVDAGGCGFESCPRKLFLFKITGCVGGMHLPCFLSFIHGTCNVDLHGNSVVMALSVMMVHEPRLR